MTTGFRASLLAGLAVFSFVSSSAAQGLPDAPGKDALIKVCGSCHEPQRSASLRLTPESWQEVIAKMVALGAKGTEQQLDARLAPKLAPFRALLGREGADPTADTFSATLDQTLFVKFGAPVRSLLAPRAGTLADRLGKLTNPDALAEELFVAILSRRPTAEERKDVAAALKTAPDRQKTINELVWALVASAEFRFNH